MVIQQRVRRPPSANLGPFPLAANFRRRARITAHLRLVRFRLGVSIRSKLCFVFRSLPPLFLFQRFTSGLTRATHRFHRFFQAGSREQRSVNRPSRQACPSAFFRGPALRPTRIGQLLNFGGSGNALCPSVNRLQRQDHQYRFFFRLYFSTTRLLLPT